MRLLTTEEVAKAPAHGLVPLYLMASYLYYQDDESPMTDAAYDLLCGRLDKEWDDAQHPHRDLVDRGALSATTGYQIRPAQYPRIVVHAARGLMRAVREGNAHRVMQPNLERSWRRRARPSVA